MTDIPTIITNGIKHHFSVGDKIKHYPKDSFFVTYGDVIRINKKSITISWVGNFGVVYTKRVCPSTLNWD